jgi:hypothetical protein
MPITRATVVIANGGEPTNPFVNVFHFSHVGALTSDSATGLTAALEAFYGAWSPYGSSAIQSGTDAHEVQFAEVTPGAPGSADDTVSKLLFRELFTFAPAAGTRLPNELAIALSYKSDLAGFPEEADGGATRPASRRRGRTFLGPFAATALDTAAPYSTVVNQDVIDVILIGYTNLINAVNLITQTMVHSIYSPSNGETYPIVQAWVDSAWDTMRSRGNTAVSRSTVDVDQGGV